MTTKMFNIDNVIYSFNCIFKMNITLKKSFLL